MKGEELKARIIEEIRKSNKPISLGYLKKKLAVNLVTIERKLFEIIAEKLQNNPEVIEKLGLEFLPMKTTKSWIFVPRNLLKKFYGGEEE